MKNIYYDDRILFPTTVVGSMPRPKFVQELLGSNKLQASGDDSWNPKLDTAVRYILEMMNNIGLDIITDGEWRRRSYTDVIAQMVYGFRLGVPEVKQQHPIPQAMAKGSYHTVIEPMHHRQHFIAKEAKFLKDHTDRKIKVSVPSPFILGQRMWDPTLSRKAYPTRRGFIEASIPFLRKEVEAIRDVGVHMIQIDEPHISGFLDSNAQQFFDNPETDLDFLIDCINQVIQGIDGVRIAIHVCRFNRAREGWRNEGSYWPVLPALQKLDVHEYALEYSIPVAGDLSALAELPEDRSIALGCVGCRNAHVDTPEEIVARVENAMKYVEKERISLTPDCGFAPAMSSPIPLDEPYIKLKNQVEAARILREKHE